MFLLFSSSIYAQSIGVALSGGGAKGMYHIGVLKALEEYDIPIDYISGASAGAIVGGMYAIGMSPRQMEELFCSEQVQIWMSGKVEEKYSYYFNNARKTATALTMPLDFNGENNSLVPSRIIPSFQIDMAFIEYFAAADIAIENNFDSLYIPFRCNATDAVGRAGVTFNQGNVGRAIRASMSIPVVFRPMREDSVLLYDGGMYNNFPWQVLKDDFEADIIIGSKCTEGNSVAHEDDVVEQIFAMMMLTTDYTLPENSVLIDRAVNASTLDFSNAAEVIELGYRDALQHMPEIVKAVGKRRISKEDRTRTRMEFRSTLPALEFDRFEVEGISEKQKEYVNKIMNLYPSERSGKERTFNYEKFKSEYFKLLSSGDFEGDYPEITYDSISGLFGVKVNLRTNPAFKVKVGGNISSTALNQAYIGLEYKSIGSMANTYYLDNYFSPMYSSVQLGGISEFFLKLPISFEYSFNYNYYNYFRSDYGILSRQSDISYSKTTDLFFLSSLTTPLSRTSILKANLHVGTNSYKYFQDENLYEDSDELDISRFEYVGAELLFDRNVLNYSLFPTSGMMQHISAVYINGYEEFTPGTSAVYGESSKADNRNWVGVKFTREHYFKVANWLSLGYYVDGVFSNHPDFSNEYATNLTMPAFQPTYHSQFIYMKEFRSNSYIATGVIPTIMFSDKFYFRTDAYAFLPDDLNQTYDGIKQRLRYIFGGTVVYQSIAGPISLSLSKYDLNSSTTGSNNWFLSFNFGYTIFNKKGLFY